MSKPSPFFVIIIIALALIATSLYLIGSILIYKQAQDSRDVLDRAEMVRTLGPDISHCVDGDPSTDIWCCVTHREEPCKD